MSQNSGFGDDLWADRPSESGLAMWMGRGSAGVENKWGGERICRISCLKQ